MANSSCYPGHNNQIGRYTHKRLDIKNITHQNNDKNGRKKKSYHLSTFIIFEWSFGAGQTLGKYFLTIFFLPL